MKVHLDCDQVKVKVAFIKDFSACLTSEQFGASFQVERSFLTVGFSAQIPRDSSRSSTWEENTIIKRIPKEKKGLIESINTVTCSCMNCIN